VGRDGTVETSGRDGACSSDIVNWE
jgi:hypothetical protein